MLEAIRKAQRTVDLMTFVYWKGRPAQQFAEALCDRAKAGLRVRVLIDALGGIQIEDGIVEAMEDSGVDVHWYRKLWLNSPFKQNHRGHRKVCIVDETIGFTGGMGIAEEWEAASRGVDVDILLPGPNADKRVAQLASEATYADLISAGIRIWNFQPSMLHTKIMVVDGAAALVGSSNVNRRSLEHDEEVAMVVIDQASVDLLDHQFIEDLQRSRQIDLSRWQRRSAPQRTLETAVTAIRRWL